MIEYKVRTPQTLAVRAPEDICNEMAMKGWRLVSTSVGSGSGYEPVWMWFEREVAG